MGELEQYKREELLFEAREVERDALWAEFEMTYTDDDLMLEYVEEMGLKEELRVYNVIMGNPDDLDDEDVLIMFLDSQNKGEDYEEFKDEKFWEYCEERC